MKEILKTYYNGVLKRLKVEIDLLNEIVPHNLTKGQNNEESLKNIISNLIPKKYSIGSGIIIDSFGEKSRQFDIIIYDNQIYPNLFNQSSNSIFPVETVLACIEVKTYLDDTILDEVTKNTESLKRLRHYVPRISINKPSSNAPIVLKNLNTIPPMSYLIAFRSNSDNPQTWKKRFLTKTLTNLPDASLLIENSSAYFFTDISNKISTNFLSTMFLLREIDINPAGPKTNFYYSDKPNHNFIINGNLYKSTSMQMDDEYPILMPERAFLAFLIELIRQLDEYPKYNMFDPTRYLNEDYINGTIIQ